MSAWKRSVSITEREFVRGPWPWRLALQTGLQRQTLGKLSTPVWRKVSGASTRNSLMVVSAPTTMSAFSVRQVALPTASQSCTSCHIAGTDEHSAWLCHTVLFNLCLVQSYWTAWSEWGPCSTTVCDDVGIQVRQRKCVNSQPMPLLLVPACQGHPSERRECSNPPCIGENYKPVAVLQ